MLNNQVIGNATMLCAEFESEKLLHDLNVNARKHVRENMQKCTEPARNRDKFTTEREAKTAFLHSYFGPTESEFVEYAFARWLDTPAEGNVE